MALTYEQMIARAEGLERFAAACRREGIIHGPEGAEDAQMAASDWRRAAERLKMDRVIPIEHEWDARTQAERDARFDEERARA